MQTDVQNHLASHRIDPQLHRVLAEQIPRTGARGEAALLGGETYAPFRGYLDAHQSEFRAVDLGLATFVCVTSIEVSTHTAVVHYADPLTDEAFSALVDETTRLIVRYLQ